MTARDVFALLSQLFGGGHLQERQICNIPRGHDFRRAVHEDDREGAEFYDDNLPVLASMPPASRISGGRGQAPILLRRLRMAVSQPDVRRCQPEKLVLGISIDNDGGLIHREKAMGVPFLDPARLRVAPEQEISGFVHELVGCRRFRGSD